MLKKLACIALTTLCVSLPAAAEEKELIGDTFVHDPSAIQEAGKWWLFSTGMGIQTLYQDPQSQIWRRTSPVFKEEPTWWASEVPRHNHLDAWAPDVRAFQGRIWLYYAISSFGSNSSAIGLASASSVAEANWRDEGMVLRSTAGADDFNAIDPDLVLDENNQPWLTFGSFWSGIKLMRVDPKTMHPIGERIGLASRPAGIEAPSIVRHGAYYYLFASIDKCCQGSNSSYKLIYGRASKITGPYVDKSGKPLLEGGGTILDESGPRWRGPGGADIVDNLVVRHAYDDDELGKPRLRINELQWKEDWPSFRE